MTICFRRKHFKKFNDLRRMTMTVTAKQVNDLAAKLGVEDIYVGPTGRGYQVEAYTPNGLVWKDTGCHTLVEYWTTNPAGCRAEALRRMAKGVEKCDQDDCGYCAEATDAEMRAAGVHRCPDGVMRPDSASFDCLACEAEGEAE
jgi:hypothetical protein